MSSNRPRPRPVFTAGPGLAAAPTLVKPTALTPAVQQLQMLQKRLGQLSRGIQELQNLLFSHPTLEDWPTLCSRYASLVSHLHGITSSLTSASPQFLTAQTADLEAVLNEEANQANLYSEQAVGTLLGADQFDPEQLPKVHYRDAIHNPLPELAAHPVLPIKEEQHLSLITNVLRTRLEPDLEAKRDENARQVFAEIERWRARTKRPPLLSAASVPPASVIEPDGPMAADVAELLSEVKAKCETHDHIALTALRMWHHLERAPDDFGETYNWKMRISRDESAEGEEEEGVQEEAEPQRTDGDAVMSGASQKDAIAPQDEPIKKPWTPEQSLAFLTRRAQ